MKSSVNWFEIPAVDIERAVRFYQSMLSVQLKREEFGGESMAMFPSEEPGVTGCIVAGPRRKPGCDGTVVYLNAPEMEEALVRVPSAGGKIVLPLTSIGEQGHIAMVQDPEGNRVGLHRPLA